MAKFKRIFSRLLRLHPKRRESVRQRAIVTHREANSLRRPTDIVPEHTVENDQFWTDIIPEDVAEFEEYEDDDKVSGTLFEVDVQEVELSADTVPKDIEVVEDCADVNSFDVEYDEDVPEVFSYDLVRKTHHEKVTRHLYVAVSDNDREIAALRTLEGKKFTHIVRVVIEPLSDCGHITPSSWSIEETDNRASRPSELRLTCPVLALRHGDKMTALTRWQLLAARNYIAQLLPSENDGWAAKGLVFPPSLEKCKNGTVLIVGPPDRSADVMATLVCYMSFLAATRSNEVLARMGELGCLGSHWGGDILCQQSLDLADQVARKKWKL